jgi:hypothetical protein
MDFVVASSNWFLFHSGVRVIGCLTNLVLCSDSDGCGVYIDYL